MARYRVLLPHPSGGTLVATVTVERGIVLTSSKRLALFHGRPVEALILWVSGNGGRIERLDER